MLVTDHFLHGFFHPRSVAVVGATDSPFKINSRLVHNLVSLGFEGRLYPVNLNANEIFGLKAYPSLADVPDSIDLVISAVPPAKTMDIVRACRDLGVERLVIVTGGFSEGGAKGRALHDEIAAFAKAHGIRTLGPNTLSPVHTPTRLAISYNPIKRLSRGGVSLVFQSGFYDARINWIFEKFGINKITDCGNKMDVNETDVLEYYALDPETRVIGMHIESLHGDGRRFFNLLKQTARKKPVVVLKSGRTASGARAAASHTGSLSRENDSVFNDMIRQTAAVRATDMDEFFDLLKAFDRLDPPRGNRLAIVTMSGGEGVMATDFCEMNGLQMAGFSQETRDRLQGIMPPWEIPLNPFDAGVAMQFHMADPLRFYGTLKAVSRDEGVDLLLMALPPSVFDFVFSNPDVSEEAGRSTVEAFIRSLGDLRSERTPFALWRTSIDAGEERAVQMLETSGLPVFESSARAIRAMAVLAGYSRMTNRNHDGEVP
ncbi:MAG: CoA-binding protein [Proteobacteria bacterium]|nr:CoA-binding protein [Pseudomonadota bacterium]